MNVLIYCCQNLGGASGTCPEHRILSRDRRDHGTGGRRSQICAILSARICFPLWDETWDVSPPSCLPPAKSFHPLTNSTPCSLFLSAMRLLLSLFCQRLRTLTYPFHFGRPTCKPTVNNTTVGYSVTGILLKALIISSQLPLGIFLGPSTALHRVCHLRQLWLTLLLLKHWIVSLPPLLTFLCPMTFCAMLCLAEVTWSSVQWACRIRYWSGMFTIISSSFFSSNISCS